MLFIFAGFSAYLIRNSQKKLPKELTSLASSLPALVWQEDDENVVWSNSKHRTVGHQFGIKNLTITDFKLKSSLDQGAFSVFGSLSTNKHPETWSFEISTFIFEGQKYHFAVNAHAAVKAEKERNRFIQNVSEAFSNSPIAIAVFDKKRDLTMFNPILSTLLELSPSWLASAPSLSEFLDRLRDNGILPEPQDFKDWRDGLIHLDQGGVRTQYQDDWNMPNGSVYRVTAMPNRDDATTLYFEDITGRTVIEREYRAHLDNLYNAFDALDTAVIMFERSGDMAFANDAFDALWEENISNSVIVPNVIDISKMWSEKCRPSPIFGDLREFVSQLDERERWDASLIMTSGLNLSARFAPLPDGQTLCEFTIVEVKKPTSRESLIKR